MPEPQPVVAGGPDRERRSVIDPQQTPLIWLKLAALFAITATVVTALHFVPVLHTAEQWTADVRVATLLPYEPQHPDIVVAAITEETLEQFPYRSPVDRAFLATVLESLAAKGARAILVDLLFDQPTEQDKDVRLASVLHNLSVPLVISYAGADAGLTPSQKAYLDTFVPPELRGFANMIKDTAGGTVRAIYPGRAIDTGPFIPGVAGRMVERLGHTAPREPVAIAFRGSPGADTQPFAAYPAHAVPFLPESWIKDKVVLIGADLTLVDRHRTPFAVVDNDKTGYMPGVVVHGHAIAQLLEGRQGAAVGPWGDGLTVAVMAGLGLLIGSWTMPLLTRLAALLLPLAVFWLCGFKLFELGGPLLPLAAPTMAFLLATGTADFLTGREERVQKRFIQTAFSRYISAELLDELINDPSRLSIEAERRELSLLFTDVAGFTSLSESLDAVTLSEVLNRYRQVLIDGVFHHGGTIIQFAGDGMFAIFGAPRAQPDHARRALACALELAERCRTFSERECARGLPFDITRVGVHTGEVNVGNFGSLDRVEYTAIGDAVNIAARVEGLNKYFGTLVAMTAATATRVPDARARLVGEVVLKGKTTPLQVLEPLPPNRFDEGFLDRYRTAYDHFAAGDLDAAKTAFRALSQDYPEDGCVGFHSARLAAGETDVVIRMKEK